MIPGDTGNIEISSEEGRVPKGSNWMFDAPGTGGQVRNVWLHSPKPGALPLGSQADVEGVYWTVYFATYVVVDKCPLLKINWHTYASWEKKLKAPADFEPPTAISFDSFELPSQFLSKDDEPLRLIGANYVNSK